MSDNDINTHFHDKTSSETINNNVFELEIITYLSRQVIDCNMLSENMVEQCVFLHNRNKFTKMINKSSGKSRYHAGKRMTICYHLRFTKIWAKPTYFSIKREITGYLVDSIVFHLVFLKICCIFQNEVFLWKSKILFVKFCVFVKLNFKWTQL